MALQIRNLGSSGNATDALLRQLAEQYSEQTQPKVGGLGRILAPLVGIGSILDAYYDARFQDKDAGLLNVLKNYGTNLLQSVGTLATGRNYEQEGKMNQLTDILDRTSPGFKYSGLGQSTLGRIGVDIAGGILTDPLTYVGFGGLSLGDDLVKAGLKGANVTDDVAKTLLPKLSGSTLDDATRFLVTNLGDDVADGFAVKVLSEASKKGTNLTSGAMKAFGKTITESPNAVKAAKAVVNPVGLVGEMGGNLLKKTSPDTYFNIKNIFDPVGAAAEAGKTDLAELLVKFNRAQGGIGRKSAAELVDSGVYDAYKNLDIEARKNIGKIIESGRRKTPEMVAFEAIEKRRPEIRDILSNALNKRTAQVGEKEFLTTLDDLFPESVMRDEELVKALTTTVGSQDKKLIDLLYEEADRFTKSGNTMADGAADSAIDKILNVLGKKSLRTARKSTDLLERGGQQELFPEIVSTMGDLPSNTQDFLDKYFSLQRGRAGELQRAGFDTISEFDMGYMTRGGNTKGYRENFITNVLSRDATPGTVDNIINNKKVQSELTKNGFVKRETLEKLLTAENKGILSTYEGGMLGDLLPVDGSTKQRMFETIRQGEAAGIVYDDNWLKTMLEQTARQDEQLLAKKFVDDLIQIKDDNGMDLFKQSPEGVYRERVVIPGTKEGAQGSVLYTDKVTRKIADDMINKFTKPEDLDQVLTKFDKVMAKWKGWVTAKGPRALPYHMRNAFDDTVRMVVGGADVKTLPEDIASAMEVVRFDDLVRTKGVEGAVKEFSAPATEAMYKSMGLDKTSAIEDLWRKSLDNGILADVTKTKAESGLTLDMLREVGGKPRPGEVVDEALSLGGVLPAREQVSRIAQFNNSLRKTGSVSRATEDVRRVLFNYNELTQAERKVFKRIIPFYGFVKNNMAFYLGTLKNNPEKIARFQNVLDGIKSGAQGQYGEEWETMPDWMKEGTSIPTGKKGDILSVLGDVGLSIGDVDETLSASGLISKMNPLLKNFIETSTGKNVFYGEDILNINDARNYANMPEVFKKLIGFNEYEGESKEGETYTRQTMSPEAKYWLENAAWLSTLMKPIVNLSQTGKGGLVKNLTETLLPVKIYEQSIEGAKQRQEREKYDALYKLLQRKGLAEEYKSFYVPAGIREQLLK